MFDTVILDWSGTLVDDLDAVLGGTNEVFRQFGLPGISKSEFCREFDLPVASFYEKYLPEIPMERLDLAYFEGFHKRVSAVQPFHFSRSFLETALAGGVRLMVLTTLDSVNARKQITDFRWNSFFDEVHAGVQDKVPYLSRLVADGNLDRHRTVFVGDLPHDIDAGQRAGIRSCAVLSGYGSREKLECTSPDFLLDDVSCLSRLMDRSEGEQVEA